MSSTITLSYQSKEINVELPQNYQKFIQTLRDVLYFTKEMLEGTTLFYLDSDGDEIVLNKDNYDEMLNENPSVIKVDLSSTGAKGNIDPEAFREKGESIKEICKKNGDKIVKKMEEKCKKKIDKLKKKHKEEIQKIKESYKKKFLNYIQENENLMKEKYQKMVESIFDVVKKYLIDYNEKYFLKVSTTINDSSLNLNKIIKNLDLEKINTIHQQVNEFFVASSMQVKNLLSDLDKSAMSININELSSYMNKSKTNFSNNEQNLQLSNVVPNSGNNNINFNFNPSNNNNNQGLYKCSIMNNFMEQTLYMDKNNNLDNNIQLIDIDILIKNVGTMNLPNDCYIEIRNEKSQEKLPKQIYDLTSIVPGEVRQIKAKAYVKCERKQRLINDLYIYSETKGKLSDNSVKFILNCREKDNHENEFGLFNQENDGNYYNPNINQNNNYGNNNTNDKFEEIKKRLKEDMIEIDLIEDEILQGIFKENNWDYEKIKKAVVNYLS